MGPYGGNQIQLMIFQRKILRIFRPDREADYYWIMKTNIEINNKISKHNQLHMITKNRPHNKKV